MLAKDDDFAFSESAIGDVKVDRLTGETLQLYDRAATEAQDVLHGHSRASELDRERKREIHQHRDGNFGATGNAVSELCKVWGALHCGFCHGVYVYLGHELSSEEEERRPPFSG